MSDPITTTTEQSWFSRLGDAIKGVVLGGLLFLVAFPVLFWNEGRAVKTHRALQEGAGAVVTADASAVAPANEGKLVHVSGKARAAGALTDGTFGVTAPEALRLVRKVEMYQWREKSESKTEKKLGGGTETTTTYSYEKVWNDSPIDSANFKSAAAHANPGVFPVTSESQQTGSVTLGAYTLNASQVTRIPAETALPPAAPEALRVPDALKSKATAAPGYTYFGPNPAAPEVGDVRVSFKAAGATDITIIAAQRGAGFAPFTTSNGRQLDMLKTGIVPAATLFEQAESSNAALTWFLRGLGFIVMGAGLSMILRPVSVFADGVPALGDLAEIGLGLIAFSSAAVLSLGTIAAAWIFYRPLLAIALLALAGGVAYAVYRRRSQKKQAADLAPAKA